MRAGQAFWALTAVCVIAMADAHAAHAFPTGDAAPDAPPQAAESKTDAARPRYGDLVLSDSDGGTSKAVFATDTPKIFLHAKLLDVPAGAKVAAAWIAEKTAVAPPNHKIDAAELTVGLIVNTTSFSLSKPNTGWPLGDYRIDLSIDGQAAGAVRFKVQ